jgi:hypothetical protein
MDYNVVALEVWDHIAHFDYYNNLVTGGEEQARLGNKNSERIVKYFTGLEFYNADKQLCPLFEIRDAIIAKLKAMKGNDIHDLIEKLEKDAKKMRKLYKSLSKQQELLRA